MLKEQKQLMAELAMLTDLACVAAAQWTADHIYRLHLSTVEGPIDFGDPLRVLAITLPVFAVSFYLQRLYSSFRVASVSEELRRVAKATAISGVTLVSLFFAIKVAGVSRLAFVIFLGLAWLFVSVERVAVRLFLRRLRRRGYNFRRIVVVGSGERAAEVIREIEINQQWGLKLEGVVTDGRGDAAKWRVLGALESLPEIIRQNVVDHVIFAVPSTDLNRIREGLEYCWDTGLQAYIHIRPFDEYAGKLHVESLGHMPLITFGQKPINAGQAFLKRAFDLAVSTVFLLLLSPLFLVLAAAVRYSSRGPVFFGQKRVGMNGRSFTLWKFRTMVADAEAKLADLAGRNEMDGPVFKIKDDPRVTAVGRWLRRTSLDELPQFLNVFLGHMSLVGPRPPLPSEVQQYEVWHRRRLSIRPGLTCLWQVSGRNRLDFKSWMELDMKYIDTWSWSLDMKILAKTVPAMLKGQ